MSRLFPPALAVLFAVLVPVPMVAQEAPEPARTAPKPIRLLLIDGQNNHRWQETSPVLRAIFENSGRFQVEVATSPSKTEDIATFRPAFSDYDVVVSNYNGQVWPAKRQAALPE